VVAVPASAPGAGHETDRSGPVASLARASDHGNAARKRHRKSVRFRRSAARAGARGDTPGPVVTPPTADDGAIPGTGPVLKQDLGTSADPVPVWRKIESAYPQQNESNPQVLYHSTGGDPRPAIGQPSPTLGYRTLFTTSGLQSLYDAGSGNDRQRTQLVNNSNTNTFYPLQPNDHYVIYLSVRYERSTSIPNDSLGDDSQIWQIKNTGTGPSGARDFIIAMEESRNELHFTHRLAGKHATLWEGGFTRGVWTRIAVDIRTSSVPGEGSIQLWGELTGNADAPLVPLTGKVSAQTAFDTDAIGKLSIGPYHRMSSGAVSRDYANIQVCDWLAP
jgi:hypothetical protein